MSGHKKNDSTCDSTALLRGQSHSRESSGASNLSVKYTITQSSDGTVASATVSTNTTPQHGATSKVPPESEPLPAVSILSSPKRRKKRSRKRIKNSEDQESDPDLENDDCDRLEVPDDG